MVLSDNIFLKKHPLNILIVTMFNPSKTNSIIDQEKMGFKTPLESFFTTFEKSEFKS